MARIVPGRMADPSPPDIPARILAVLPRHARRICVGFSGGLDSTVLLHALAALRRPASLHVEAIHVHHGLSPQADAWAAHCARVCAALEVPLVLRHVRPAVAGKGLEAAARELRHAAFAQVDADLVALAHHLDDQAETVLHRLLRGAGVAGAAAMRGQDEARRLWRPLLGCARSELECWAQQHKLSWIEDESNTDTRFTRNFLRHDVLPLLTAKFPAATRNLARAAAHFAEAAELLDELAAGDAECVVLAAPGARAVFRALPAARQRNLLRFWLRERCGLAPDAFHTSAFCRALAGEAAVYERVGERFLCAWRDRIWFEALPQQVPERFAWRGEQALRWGGWRIWLEPDPAGVPLPELDLVVRARRGGERMRLAENRPSRELRLLFQEAAVPAWWRDALPLLWAGDRLLWVGGVGAAAPEVPAPDGLRWRIRWRGPDGVEGG